MIDTTYWFSRPIILGRWGRSCGHCFYGYVPVIRLCFCLLLKLFVESQIIFKIDTFGKIKIFLLRFERSNVLVCELGY